jgi:hypothetical protein
MWIVLDSPDHMNALHYPGDVLRGKAYLRPKLDTALTAVMVRFKCEIATGVRETVGVGSAAKSNHRWNGTLFSYTITYVDAPAGIVLNGEQVFPFEFVIPSVTMASDIRRVFPASEVFEAAEGKPLPPSFYFRYQTHAEQIEYSIEIIEKHKGGVFDRGYTKDKLPIQFSPARYTLHPALQLQSRTHTWTVQSKQLDPTQQNIQRPFRIKKLFGSSSLEPLARFSISGTVPATLCAEGPIPIQLALEYLASDSTASEIPDVHLCSIFVRLRALTLFRVPASRYPGPILRKITDKLDIVHATFPEQPVLPQHNQSIQLDQMVPNLLLKPALKPTFKSWALSRFYYLKATVELRVKDQCHELELSNHHCLVLPATYRPPPPVRAAQAVVSNSQLISGSLSPPRYHQAGPTVMSPADGASEETEEPLPLYES